MRVYGLERVSFDRVGDDVVATLYKWRTPPFLHQHLCNVRPEKPDPVREREEPDTEMSFEKLIWHGQWSHHRGQFRFYYQGHMRIPRSQNVEYGQYTLDYESDDVEFKGEHPKNSELRNKIVYGFRVTD